MTDLSISCLGRGASCRVLAHDSVCWRMKLSENRQQRRITAWDTWCVCANGPRIYVLGGFRRRLNPSWEDADRVPVSKSYLPTCPRQGWTRLSKEHGTKVGCFPSRHSTCDAEDLGMPWLRLGDRKSTRLNSSHVRIS